MKSFMEWFANPLKPVEVKPAPQKTVEERIDAAYVDLVSGDPQWAVRHFGSLSFDKGMRCQEAVIARLAAEIAKK